MAENKNKVEEVVELDWDEEIDDGSQFENVIFDEGNYEFTVINFKRDRSKKNGNNMAVIDIEVTDGEKTNTVRDWFVLTNKNIWKIANFFRSIGLKKHGEKTKMKWKESVGMSGMCTLIVDERVSDKGRPYKVNQIKSYLDPIEDDDDFEW